MKEKASNRIHYYENPQGPVIGTCSDKVIQEDGLYFRDINGDGKLNTYKDWRKAPQERAQALAEELIRDCADNLRGKKNRPSFPEFLEDGNGAGG